MKKILSLFISAVMVLAVSSSSAYAASDTDINRAIKEAGNYLYTATPDPGFGHEWIMYSLSKSGCNLPDEYISSYSSAASSMVAEVKGELSSRKYTEYSRVVLAYAQLGLNPQNVSGYNLVEKLYDYDAVVWQGINGPIWALRALDSLGDGNNLLKEKYIECILDAQLADGGWDITGKAADSDMTGMAVSALAPYYRTEAKVKAAVDKAVTRLSKIQNSDGGYSTVGTPTAESCAQVIYALASLGINPNTDSRFIKNGKSAVDALMSYYISDKGAFAHLKGGAANGIATEQALYSLAQYRGNIPVKGSISSVKKYTSKSVKCTWKKQSGVNGYQIKVATNAGFTKGVKNVYVTSGTKSSKVINLIKGKKYYVKVRAYKTVNGNKVYGLYSSV
ncbi:MAG: hypothetical protein ACI4KE_00430, partial [Anaerovoracaceae bacterium]